MMFIKGLNILSLLATLLCMEFSIGLNAYEESGSKSIQFEFLDENVSSSNEELSTEVERIDNDKVYDLKFFVGASDIACDYIAQRPSPNSGYSISDFQKQIFRLRNSLKNANLQNCEDVLSALSTHVSLENPVVNPYSSTIKFELSEDELSEDLLNNITKVIQSIPEVEEVYLSEVLHNENLDEIDDAMEVINVADFVVSGEYTGRNVNIGIAESGGIIRPSVFTDDYSGRNITLNGTSTNSRHADQVAMIAAGNNGIARGSNIFSTEGTPYNNNYMEWLIDNNVNIVNTSFGDKNPSTGGSYTSVAKEMDRIIRNNFITVVGSAGNHDKNYDSDRTTSPKTAFNYITVGATEESYPSTKKSYYSCYEEQDGYNASKPNLVAPGAVMTNGYLDVPTYSESNKPKGTSFASPQVVGCIALLMEEFPYLVAYPELVMSIVTSSASPMSSSYNSESGENRYDGSGLHNQIGSGLLNYEKMREAASQYLSITRPKNSSAGLIPQHIDILATDDQRIRASSSWLYSEETFTDYDLELYKLDVDGTMDRVAYINDPHNNVEFIDFDVQTTGTYRLVVNQKGQNAANDFIGLSYVLIDDEVGGSTSGATNIDNTLDSQFTIDRSIYQDYGDTYNNEAITETQTNDGLHIFETTRIRARYTDDGKLVLSAKSNDANSAQMEYRFDTTDATNDNWGLYNIQYEFGLWSSDESLIRNSSIDLYGLYRGSWLLIRHFDPKEMSTDPNNLKTYVDCLDFPVNGLRFYVSTNFTNNDNNVGRVVIGNIKADIHYHLYTKYEQDTEDEHKATCGCGDCYSESHTWGPSYMVGTNEYANCTKCNEQHRMTSGGPIVTPIV